MSPREIKTSITIIVLLCLAIVFVIIKAPKPKHKINAIPRDQYTSNNLLDAPSVFVGDDKKEYIVNTEIIKSDDSHYDYMNTANNFQTYFPVTTDKSKNIKFQVEDAWVSFNIASLLTIKKNDANNKEVIVTQKTIDQLIPVQGQTNLNGINKNSFFYPKIYQDGDKFIDIKYVIYDNRLMEQIILNKYQDFPELTQHLSLHNTYIKVEDLKINFYDKKTNKILWHIEPPRMFEQQRQYQASFGLQYDLKCDNPKTSLDKCKELTLTKKFTDEGKHWISSPDRQFPVVLDPNFQVDNADTAANWVSSDPVNFAVSQETTIKKEGTGAVKIVGLGTTSFWGIGSLPDINCNIATTTPVSVYTTCGSNLCVARHWDQAGCNYTSYNTGSVANSCTAGTECGTWGAGCSYTSYSALWNIPTGCTTSLVYCP